MALPDGTLPFSGGAMMGGDGSNVSRDDIFKLRMTRGGLATEVYDPLQSPDTEVDINQTELFSITQPGIYSQIEQSLSNGRTPTISAGADGHVRLYYYTARDMQAGTMGFANAHDRVVEILTLHSDGTYEIAYGGASVPLVRVAFQNGAWSKLYGDDGFIKANEFGQQALYLPEGGWWHIDANLAVKNNTAQDLLQHISLEWNWNFFIEESVPWGSYAAAGFPSMMHQIDYTRTATNNRCFGFVVNKDGSHTNDWLSVGLNAYEDTLPNSVDWAVWMDIFKVRDA